MSEKKADAIWIDGDGTVHRVIAGEWPPAALHYPRTDEEKYMAALIRQKNSEIVIDNKHMRPNQPCKGK